MDSNKFLDFDYSCDYFNFTKYCPACMNRRTIKIPMRIYGEFDRCKRTEEQLTAPSFSCSLCDEFNEINIKEVLADIVLNRIERRTLLVTRNVLHDLDKSIKRTNFDRKKELLRKNLKMKST